jgi:hypothetical protein
VNRAALTIATLIASVLAQAVASAGEIARGPQDPYNYLARERLVTSSRRAGEYDAALYHAAWLYWLAPREYAERAEEVLGDRQVLDRARRAGREGPVEVVLAAVEARRVRLDVCLSGRVESQAPVREERITNLIARAEAAQVRGGGSDPVIRGALADLYLTLDDIISLSGSPARVKARRQTLHRAVAAAEAVTQSLPNAPGAYRLLTVARARLAELSNDPEEWDLAITACAHALAPDPDDAALCETMWGLHLRAGHWEEAKRWQSRCETRAR